MINSWIVGFKDEELPFPPLDLDTYSQMSNKITVEFTKDQSNLINSSGWEIYRKNMSLSGPIDICIYVWDEGKNLYIDLYTAQLKYVWWSMQNQLKRIIYTYTSRIRSKITDLDEMELRSKFRRIAAEQADEKKYSSNIVRDFEI